jgi:hypothetical protein
MRMTRGSRATVIALAVLAALTVAIALTLGGCESFGEHASGERLARMERSPEWQAERQPGSACRTPLVRLTAFAAPP